MKNQVTVTNDVFFDPAGDQFGPVVIDAVLSNGRGQYGGKSIEQLRHQYPLVRRCRVDVALQWIEDYHRTEPQEITRDQYWEMLEVLPPVGWKIYDSAESFKMSERLTGNITGIYARVGASNPRYFTFYDSINMKHDQIIEKVQASAAYKAKK